MKRRHFLCLLVALGCLLGLSGCGVDFYCDRRPAADEDARWVCEAPEMWFSFVPNVGHRGELVLDGETIPVAVCFNYGTGMDVFPLEAITAEGIWSEARIFMGNCDFGWDEYSDFTMAVVKDRSHPFGDEPPTFRFVCQRRQEDGTWK